MSGASTTAHDKPCPKFRALSWCSKERRDEAGAIGAPNRRPEGEVRGSAVDVP
jgi:hypothetical protein